MWGTSDFFGGLASKQQSVARVLLWAHGIGLVGVAAVAPFLADQFLWSDIGWGALAGMIGMVGMLLLYWSLAAGPMAIVAPLSALTAALLPVIWKLPGGDPLSALTIAGLIVGLAAVVAISWEGSPGDGPSLSPAVVAAAIVAGACFGSIVLFYDATSQDGAPWPVVGGRVVSTATLLAFALVRRQPVSPGPTLKFSAIAGLGDTAANVTLLAATGLAVSSSELSVVAVIASFYPAATVLWARFSLNEQLGPIRLAGLGLGLAAIAFMTLG